MQRFEEIKKRKFVKARLSNNSVLFACAAFLLKHLCLIIVKNINKKLSRQHTLALSITL